MTNDQQKLAECYGTVHAICELFESFYDSEGRPKAISSKQLSKLKRLTKVAAAEAEAIRGTFDGQPLK